MGHRVFDHREDPPVLRLYWILLSIRKIYLGQFTNDGKTVHSPSDLCISKGAYF